MSVRRRTRSSANFIEHHSVCISNALADGVQEKYEMFTAVVPRTCTNFHWQVQGRNAKATSPNFCKCHFLLVVTRDGYGVTNIDDNNEQEVYTPSNNVIMHGYFGLSALNTGSEMSVMDEQWSDRSIDLKPGDIIRVVARCEGEALDSIRGFVDFDLFS